MGDERVVPVVVRVLEGAELKTVNVGQAIVSDGEVVLSLEPLRLVLEEGVHTGAPVARPEAPGPVRDLERLAQRSRRLLADPRKARWHADVRAQLANIEAELSRLKARWLTS